MAYTLNGPDLLVLLIFWTNPAIGEVGGRSPGHAVHKTLIPMGLMECVEGCYRVTEKGDVYIRHLLKQPLPVEIPLVTWGYPAQSN